MSASAMIMPPAVSKFERLPPEVRNMIYALWAVDTTVFVRSPQPREQQARKEKKETELRRGHGKCLGSLLAVNKSIKAESSSFFYQESTFVFGNASWASKTRPNQHAMKVFLKRLPRSYATLVRIINFTIHGRYSYILEQHILGVKEDITDMKSMLRSIVMHFPALTRFNFVLERGGPYHSQRSHGLPVSGDDLAKALRAFLDILVRVTTLTRLKVFESTTIPLHEAAQRLVWDRPELAEVVIVSDESVSP